MFLILGGYESDIVLDSRKIFDETLNKDKSKGIKFKLHDRKRRGLLETHFALV